MKQDSTCNEKLLGILIIDWASTTNHIWVKKKLQNLFLRNWVHNTHSLPCEVNKNQCLAFSLPNALQHSSTSMSSITSLDGSIESVPSQEQGQQGCSIICYCDMHIHHTPQHKNIYSYWRQRTCLAHQQKQTGKELGGKKNLCRYIKAKLSPSSFTNT